MDWLKAILETAVITEGVLDVEGTLKAIQVEFPKHAVPKETFNEVNGKLKTANDTIDTLTKDNADNEALQSEITEYKAEITRLEAVAESQKKEYGVRESLKKAGCNDPDYLIYKHGGVDKFPFDQMGMPIGIEEIAKGYKESLSYLFENKEGGNSKPPVYVPKGGNSGSQSAGKSIAESLNQETMKNPYQDAWA